MERNEMIEINLGELIVALTDEAAPFVRDQEEINRTVAFMLSQLLNNSNARSRAWQYWQ